MEADVGGGDIFAYVTEAGEEKRFLCSLVLLIEGLQIKLKMDGLARKKTFNYIHTGAYRKMVVRIGGLYTILKEKGEEREEGHLKENKRLL